jgi:phosphatidate cytidylyltransferase
MACICYYEFAGIAAASGVQGPLWVGYVAGVIAIRRFDLLPVLLLAVITLSLTSRDLSKALGFAAATALAIIYIFVAWSFAIPLRAASPWWILFALSITWAGDIAAYYVGRAVGRHKLAPRISPGKSWEGAIASAAAAVLFGVAFNRQFSLGLVDGEMALLSLIANMAGQIGDLAESAFKRGAGMKDSSNLLPGHGGFLDRLDSTLFSMPVVYYFLLLSGRAI